MKTTIVMTALCACLLPAVPGHAADAEQAAIRGIVAEVVPPLMRRYGIPGMAVGIVADGRSPTYDFGVASKATGTPVTDDTLFELGSLSKTFTATLASYAQVGGRLSLADPASTYVPALRGSSFDAVSLLNLGTHTSGGLPLQVPDAVTDDDQLMRYFREWKPTYPPGTYRTYANPSIGLLGRITAMSMNEDFRRLVERALFRPLGMTHAYFDVPAAEMGNYAQGYTKTDAPIRMAPGVLAAEAYGIRTTASDMTRFVEANMGMIDLSGELRQAIAATHTGYYTIGSMTQDLIWEQYRYPVALKDLLAGNGPKISYEANPALRIDPPLSPRADVLIDKTGSTNGFGCYVAFIPEKKLGIVLLANKNYPIDARVTAALTILSRLADRPPRR